MGLGSRLRGGAGMIAVLVTGCAQPATRGGIVSVNPCADALLVRLVAPERIAAISHYSQDRAATSIPLGVARRFRATGGTAEEVIALRPSLVLASTFTPAATRDAYRRAGLRVLFLDSPVTVAASVAQVREVAAAVGEARKGEEMAESITDALRLQRRLEPSCDGAGCDGSRSPSERVPNAPQPSLGPSPRAPSALLLISGDLANGSGTLLDELMTRAGLRNAAADYGLRYTGRVPLEVLAAKPPAIVIAPDRGGRTAALRRTLLPDTPQATFPRQLINCGGPSIPSALARLRAIRASLP